MKKTKRIASLLLALTMSLGIFTACTSEDDTSSGGTTTAKADAPAADAGNTPAAEPAASDVKQLNVYSFTDEVPNELLKWAKAKGLPDDYFNITIIATTDGAYQPALDEALAGGSVDIFCAEAAFIKKYVDSPNVASYAELGIDVAAETAAAGIAPYTIEVGSDDNGVLKGLGYQATGGAFIYRRSIAKDVLGTDDPDEVQALISDWDKFFEVARKLADKNIAVVSGDGDLWHPLENSREGKWVDENNNLVLDANIEKFFDFSKWLYDENLSNRTQDWTEAWYADMAGTGDRPAFGFFGPAWLINYVMKGNSGGSAPGEGTYGDWAITPGPQGFYWGGTWLLAAKDTKAPKEVADVLRYVTLDASKDGLQYAWASGDTVASSVVMEQVDGHWDFIGGQDAFSVFVPANDAADGHTLSAYDEKINSLFREQVRLYADGSKSKEDAIVSFKSDVQDAFSEINID